MTRPKTTMNDRGLDNATWLTYVLRWPTGASRDWVTRTLPELCANGGSVLAVVLLGSAVRPADSSFDFDCLYVYKGARPVFPRAPTEVDIRGFDSARIETVYCGRARPTHLVDQARASSVRARRLLVKAS